MNEGNFEYLNVVQGQSDKSMVWVSKLFSTTALQEPIRWKRASEVVFCHTTWVSDGLVRGRRGLTPI